MKKIKYLNSLQKEHKQKSQNNSFVENNNTEYLISLKDQAIKTFYDVQKDFINKNNLRITVKHSQNSLSRYQSRSDHKEQLRKTFTSIQMTPKLQQHRKHNKLENSFVNIKKMLKSRTQSSENQNQKMKNPFYKIQKCRKLSQLASISQVYLLKNANNSLKNKVQNLSSQNVKTQNLKQQISLNEQNFLVSRNKMQWYFASKKHRFRTSLIQQTSSGSQKKSMTKNQKQILQKSPEPVEKTEKTEKTQLNTPKQHQIKHKKTLTSISQFSDDKILSFKHSQRIIPLEQQNIIMEVSREQSPVKIRQKSLTVKYNEIKDYFEKKYVKNTENFQCYLSQDNQN